MNTRTMNANSGSAAAELKAVLAEMNIAADFAAGDADLVLPGPVPVRVEVRSASRPSLAQLRRWGLEAHQVEGNDRVVVLVADWIDPGLREELKRASWGWLERAGHLRLVAGGFHIDREVEPLLAPQVKPPSPLRRESALAVALELLARKAAGPDTPWDVTVREIAAASKVSVGSAHKAITELTDVGLLGRDSSPRSALFWSVAREWRVQWFALAQPPAPDVSEAVQRLLRFRRDDLDAAGWAAAGDGAAAVWGAPIVTEAAPRLLLPDDRALTWALRTFGEATDERSASALVAVPPTAAAVRRRRPQEPWPLARRIVIAIELASSGPRGREALEQWPDRPKGLLDDR